MVLKDGVDIKVLQHLILLCEDESKKWPDNGALVK
jgi:hypothetical protein